MRWIPAILTARGVLPLLVSAFALQSCFLEFRPLPDTMTEKKQDASAAKRDPNMVYRFFDDDYVSGGYSYIYPDESRIFIPEESGHESEVALQFDLVADDYSGGSVCLYNLLYDVDPYRARGALQFWVKGDQGGEVAWVALVDDENKDGVKTVVRLPLKDYGGITSEWRKVQVPLADFGSHGVYWDPKKRVEVPHKFDWDAVAEFRIEIKKGDNQAFRIWVDDIYIVRDVFEAREIIEEERWEDIEETLPAPPLAEAPETKPIATLFADNLPTGAFVYVYGKRTAYKVQPTDSKDNQGVLAMYQNNDDFSGVTLAMGQGNNINLGKWRKTNAGLAFWGRGAPGVQKIYLGILDDESDGKKVQTKVSLSDFGSIDTAWRYYMVPLKAFQDQGLYWDASKQAEISDDVKWDAVNEVRFSVNRYENKVGEGEPAAFYIDQMSFIEEIPGYVDPEEYWASFQSDAPDVVLHTFEDKDLKKWTTGTGPKSKVEAAYVKEPKAPQGSHSLKITYELGDWADVMYNYKENGSPAEHRDWSKHWGLKFNMYTEKPYQGITVQISDTGDELFVSSAGGTKGWHEVLVPFKDFHKFPYYQPPEAEENGKFDLDNVVKIDFKPSGEGSRGWFAIDNVMLTNSREAKKAPVKEQVDVSLTPKWDKVVTEKINDAIFGINAALWDGDMLNSKTEKYVKAVNHGVLRYPGGLRADEDHWQEVLQAKDWMVDTDEFLEFTKTTGNTAMITVNFGRGTPEEAAAWVEHVNKKKKANVTLWEVGNELYGDWHANQCTPEEYGKRAAEFIKAMKEVDANIKVAVVWVLTGEWNKIVFDHTKDLADAVIIHHYPQHAGEENDYALLAAPQTLNDIIPDVREQVKKYGKPGKSYEIWLTEWNSVDFKPGPQTLSIVNGLFLADYLGQLAIHNIEQASYWDIHNNLTPEGGDYGYLSRTGDPAGDNVPRPSYWAFRLASLALRGKLASCESGDDNVTCYLAEDPSGKKSVLLINKYPKTKAAIKWSELPLKGSVNRLQLTRDSGLDGYSTEKASPEDAVLPPYSITVFTERKL